jgi:hypothetical protein
MSLAGKTAGGVKLELALTTSNPVSELMVASEEDRAVPLTETKATYAESSLRKLMPGELVDRRQYP